MSRKLKPTKKIKLQAHHKPKKRPPENPPPLNLPPGFLIGLLCGAATSLLVITSQERKQQADKIKKAIKKPSVTRQRPTKK